jgi:hypothetical protein
VSAPGEIRLFLATTRGRVSWLAAWNCGDPMADGDSGPVDPLPGGAMPSPAGCWWVAAAAAIERYLRHSDGALPERVCFHYDRLQWNTMMMLDKPLRAEEAAIRAWVREQVDVERDRMTADERAWVERYGHRAAASMLVVGSGFRRLLVSP